MSFCLVVQPIHPCGLERLRTAGIPARVASSADMETISREIRGASAVITRNAGLDRTAIEAAVDLLVIGVHGIGVDPIDVAYATEIGIPLVCTPLANTQSVAEHAMALMLALARDIVNGDSAVRHVNTDFRYTAHFSELSEKTIGIIGFGRIGQRTAQIAKDAFAMRVVVYGRERDTSLITQLGMERSERLEDLLVESDVVSLHLPLNAETRYIIAADQLRCMKPSAILINTARGGLINEVELCAALDKGEIAGAALDVVEQEPLSAEHCLARAANVILSPHTGGSTEEALARTADQVTAQVIDVLAGQKPPHIVNPEVWSRRRQPASIG